MLFCGGYGEAHGGGGVEPVLGVRDEAVGNRVVWMN